MIREKMENAWGIDYDPPREVGLTIMEMSEGMLKGQIRGLYIMGENPVLSDPDANHLVKALKCLDFLVVQDLFLTETARLAHLVLPGSSFAEKEGTFTNTERRVQRVRQAIPPLGESRPDSQIICELSTRMGYPMHIDGAEAIFEEIRSVTPSYAGITYGRLEENRPAMALPHPGTSRHALSAPGPVHPGIG